MFLDKKGVTTGRMEIEEILGLARRMEIKEFLVACTLSCGLVLGLLAKPKKLSGLNSMPASLRAALRPTHPAYE